VFDFFLMPEVNDTAIKGTCMDVRNVLINVVSDRLDQQSCGTCILFGLIAVALQARLPEVGSHLKLL